MKNIVTAGLSLLLVLTAGSYYSVQAQTIEQNKSENFGLKIPDTNINITGCTAPGSLVYISNDNVSTGTVVSDANGEFTKILLAQPVGIHTIKGYSQDSDNKLTATSSEIVAVASQQETDIELQLSPTVSHSPSQVTQGQQIQFTGYACPGAAVTLNIDNNLTLQAIAGSDGRWTLSLSTIAFTVGQHTYEVSAVTESGQTDVSQKFSFNIIATVDPPQVPSIPASLTVPVIRGPQNGYVSNQSSIVLNGTGPRNTQIEVYANGELIGSVFTNSRGEWSLTVDLYDETTVFITRSCKGNVCTESSNLLEVAYIGDNTQTQPCSLKLSLEDYRFDVSRNGIDLNINIEGVTLDEAKMTIDWGDVNVQNSNINSNKIRTHHNYQSIGNFNGTVTVKENDNCSATKYFSVQVREASQRWWLWWLGLLALVVSYKTIVIIARSRRQS